MIAVAGIAEVIHPEKIVVGRMVDAVRTFEAQSENGHADEVEKNSVVRAAADAGIGQIRIGNFFSLLGLDALARGGFLPRLVQSFAGRVLQCVRGFEQHGSERCNGLAMKNSALMWPRRH